MNSASLTVFHVKKMISAQGLIAQFGMCQTKILDFCGCRTHELRHARLALQIILHRKIVKILEFLVWHYLLEIYSLPSVFIDIKMFTRNWPTTGLQIYGGPGSLFHDFKIWPITFQGRGLVDPSFLVVKISHFNKNIHLTVSLLTPQNRKYK